MFDKGRLHERKYLCKNLGVKEGGRYLVKGGIFSGAYSVRQGTKATLLIFHKSVYEYKYNVNYKLYTTLPGVGPGFLSMSPACSRSRERYTNR